MIEGNLSLLYAPHQLCDQGEAIAEALLEGFVLGGPEKQRLCARDPWAVLGKPDDLIRRPSVTLSIRRTSLVDPLQCRCQMMSTL